MSELESHTQLFHLLSDLSPQFQNVLFESPTENELIGDEHERMSDEGSLPLHESLGKSGSASNIAPQQQQDRLENQQIASNGGDPHNVTIAASSTANAHQQPVATTNHHQDDLMLLVDENDLNLTDFMLSDPSNSSLLESFFPNLEMEQRKRHDVQQKESQQNFSRNTDTYIRLVQGFVNAPKERQPGGKDNVRYPLPLQSVKLLTELIPRGVDIYDLSVTAHVLGFEKNKKDKVVLGSSIDERKFVQEGDVYLAKFDNLIIKYSSHLHGSKLAVRFTLLDAQRQEVCFVDSQAFATITKRGVEKRKERRTAKRKRVFPSTSQDSSITKDSPDSTPSTATPDTASEKKGKIRVQSSIHSVEPPCGPCQGGLMAKIRGEALIATPISQMLILFGVNPSPEIVSVKRNTIICEVPSAPAPGMVDVSVTISSDDRKGADQISSDATYKYLDENSPEDLQELLQAMFKKKLNIITSPTTPLAHQQGTQISKPPQPIPFHSSSSNPSHQRTAKFSSFSIPILSEPAVEQFMMGQLKDVCGFSILHHAARRGFTQLLNHVTNRLVDDIDDCDNFGRTALMWSVEGGHAESARLLFEMGAEISHKDDVNDNMLHIAARTENVEALEAFLCYLIHQDDIYCSTANVLLEMLDQENDYGETPFSIAEEKDTLDMENLFDMIHSTCEDKLKRDKTFPVADIVLRSGEDNGKRLSDLGCSHMSMHFLANQFEIYLTNHMERYMAVIPHDIIAFVILSEGDERVEFTFKQSPNLFRLQKSSGHEDETPTSADDQHDPWAPFDESFEHPLSRSLSFFATLSTERIRKIYPFIQSCASLHEFKPMAFVFQDISGGEELSCAKNKSSQQKTGQKSAFSHKPKSMSPSMGAARGLQHQKVFAHPFMNSKTHPIVGNASSSEESRVGL
eukprot:CAMPEP_0117445928 /NCGR_PEP_ID=MMETSP0759-20121206/6061_1 /TAXON_ID=63605 /ORGANISM="Percolomonas cosmopolitus, Strain WS" /LENGTH=910 /DNA_ID=CAMNT_0005238145 /DNA_START=91 /DNA_END=2823 /DNA_ORIENTATION=+